jgi:hypothetical protein
MRDRFSENFQTIAGARRGSLRYVENLKMTNFSSRAFESGDETERQSFFNVGGKAVPPHSQKFTATHLAC